MEKILLKDIAAYAHKVLAHAGEIEKNSAVIVAFHGDLGAGKTTFTQALARELGVAETVQSPTYVLLKSYPTTNTRFTRLVHIDAYRLTDASEFAALDPQHFLTDPHTLVCIEWPERVAGALPAPDITLTFSAEGAGEGERYVAMK